MQFPTRGLATALAAALLMTACGGSDDATSGSADTQMEDADHQEEGEHEDDEHAEGGPAGEPAEADQADRTVEIEMLDSLAYQPSSVSVAAGETVTFVVTNAGEARHEFVLGSTEEQEAHEAEMAEMRESGEMMMHDDPNAIALDGGESGELTWHFSEATTVEFACHEPGHYAGGMIGTIDVAG